MDIFIRQERPEEYSTTVEMVKEAFLHEEYSDKKEHLLVNKIRKSDAFIPELSLVAINQSDEVVGHILLSKITIVDHDKVADSLALAPVSVAPSFQNKGIGRTCMMTVINEAKEADLPIHLQVLSVNTDAMRFYVRLGFKEIGRNSTHIQMKR